MTSVMFWHEVTVVLFTTDLHFIVYNDVSQTYRVPPQKIFHGTTDVKIQSVDRVQLQEVHTGGRFTVKKMCVDDSKNMFSYLQ